MTITFPVQVLVGVILTQEIAAGALMLYEDQRGRRPRGNRQGIRFIPFFWLYVVLVEVMTVKLLWKSCLLPMLKYISKKTGIDQFDTDWSHKSRPSRTIL